MKPNEIRRLGKAYGRSEVATSRFLMRWIAWEATQYRTLVVVCHRLGWAIGDAELVVDAARASSMARFRKSLARVLGRPADLVVSTWNALATVETARNKLAHGVATFAPAMLDVFSELVASTVGGKREWIRDPEAQGALEKQHKHERPKKREELAKLLKVSQSDLRQTEAQWDALPADLDSAKQLLSL